jgi:ATP-dependent Lon protease
MMDSDKIQSIFGPEKCLIHKGISVNSDNFRQLPRYVSEFLINHYVDPTSPGSGLQTIQKLLDEYYVDSTKRELVKSKVRQHGCLPIFGLVRARYEQHKDVYLADVPSLGDDKVRVAECVLRRHGDDLLTTGVWGSVNVMYDRQSGKYPFIVADFTPMQTTKIDINNWVLARENFNTNEWIDLIITSIGFNPLSLSHDEKMLYLYRLIPLIQCGVNIVELGPPESGKTYTYRNISTYSHVISGSSTTMATLFYNKLRRKIGAVGKFDCILFDEIAHADLRREMVDIVNTLKDFMGSGKFGRDGEEFSSDCSIVLAGNIDTDRKQRRVSGFYRHLFSPLPKIISEDRAFLDRIHGYIPGWCAHQIIPSDFADTYGWMMDYFSEVMHRMRTRNYEYIIQERVDMPGMGQRNKTSILRLATGLIKLIFPHRTHETIQNDELAFVLQYATDLRQRVVDQLAVISPGEFGGKLSFNIREGCYASKNIESTGS